MTRRHRWGKDDVCANCGIKRSGYGGGRTGWMTYLSSDGSELGVRAPTCDPIAAPPLTLALLLALTSCAGVNYHGEYVEDVRIERGPLCDPDTTVFAVTRCNVLAPDGTIGCVETTTILHGAKVYP